MGEIRESAAALRPRDRANWTYLGDINLGAGNHGTCQRGTEQVHVLIDGIASNGGEAELLDEFTADVDDLTLQGTDGKRLLAGSFEVLYGKSLVSNRVVAGADSYYTFLANIGH